MNEWPPDARRTRRAAAVAVAFALAAVPALPTLAAPPAGTGGTGADAVAPPAADNRPCLRCHGMATLAYRDPDTGGIVALHVDPRRLSHSVHGELACADCHQEDYERYPHPEVADRAPPDCVDCHERHRKEQAARGPALADADAAPASDFAGIQAQYRQSVHATSDAPEARDFSCHSCHDPHAFSVSRPGKDLASIVGDGNRICLSCHQEVQDPLRALHAWLPNREAHWAAVRCVDCHAPLPDDRAERVSHRILPAAESTLTCVNCHSSDQHLLNRLYAYRSREEQERAGMLSRALFNEAYVVGMSRAPLIDRVALSLMGLTLLGLIAHGLGRYRAHRRARAATSGGSSS